MAFTYNSYNQSDALKKKEEEKNAHNTYTESQSVTDARNALNNHLANSIGDWTGGTYGASLQDTINKIANREAFSYDLNADALYQQYKDKYITQGKLAMADTVGQASALTGGYSNSYAVNAGNQAYQASLQNLNDIVPELYQLALNKYNMEGDQLKDLESMYQSAYNTERSEYDADVAKWQNQRDYLDNAYNNAYNQDYTRFSSDRDYYSNEYYNAYNQEYGQYTDNYNRAFANYQQSVSEDQWNKNYQLQQAQLAATQAAANATQKALSASKTTNATKYSKSGAIMDRKYWGTGMSSSYERLGMSYDDYVAEQLTKAIEDGNLTASEAMYLANDVYKIKY